MGRLQHERLAVHLVGDRCIGCHGRGRGQLLFVVVVRGRDLLVELHRGLFRIGQRHDADVGVVGREDAVGRRHVGVKMHRLGQGAEHVQRRTRRGAVESKRTLFVRADPAIPEFFQRGLGKEVVPRVVVFHDGEDVAFAESGGAVHDIALEIEITVDEHVVVGGDVSAGANGSTCKDVFGRHHVGHDVGIGNDGFRGFDITFHQEVTIEVIAQDELVGDDGVGVDGIGLIEPGFTALGTPRFHVFVFLFLLFLFLWFLSCYP